MRSPPVGLLCLLTALGQRPAAGQSDIRADRPTRTVGGFKLERSSIIETVFGGVENLITAIDQFDDNWRAMGELRTEYYRTVQHALASAQVTPSGPPSCPESAGGLWVHANRLLKLFRGRGSTLQATHDNLQAMHAAGESAGLTDAYRNRVEQALRHLAVAKRDHLEMKFAMGQLQRELQARRCTVQALAQADESEPPVGPPTLHPARTSKPIPDAATRDPHVSFFIDNLECEKPAQLYIDHKPVAHVLPRERHAFQTTPGYHALCLEGQGLASCRAPHNHRRAFIHDGWALRLRCAN